MSWEKSRFSYVMWFLYVLVTGWALFRMARMIASSIPEESQYGGILLALEVALVTGCVVFLIYRFRSRHLAAGGDGLSFSITGQTIITALIVGTGLVFRITRMSGAADPASFFEMARVAEGQHAPQLVHGASHIYVQLLHVVLMFIGNKPAAGVWLQIILQIGAALLLYFAIRKLVGALAATVSLAYLMFSGYMIQESLELSPRMLYLLLFALGLFIVSLGVKDELKPLWFLGKGLLIGILGFFDAGGFLLLFFMVAIIQAVWEEEPEVKQKLAAAGIGLVSAVVGFGAMILADALLSGKSASRIFDVWQGVYWSDRFQVPVHQSWDGIGLASILLLVTLTIGIFSYWYDRERERLSVWVLAFCGTLIAGVFGVFTDEIPGDIYLYLITIVLAGIGVDECFRKSVSMVPVMISSEETEEVIPARSSAAPSRVNTPTSGSDEIWEPAPSQKHRAVSQPVPQVQSEPIKPTVVIPEEKTVAAQKDEEEEEVWGSPASKTASSAAVTAEEEKRPAAPIPEKKPETKYIDNPLPLPKPHQKRTMAFDKEPAGGTDDYDHPVRPNDDFDIK